MPLKLKMTPFNFQKGKNQNTLFLIMTAEI